MIEELLPKKVKEIEEYLPNLDVCKIRLDANESPFLPSAEILKEFQQTIAELAFDRYPDPFASETIGAFAKKYKCDPQNVVAGNGSDELISLISNGFTEPGDRVLTAVPDFSMYEFYSTFAGAKAIRLGKDENLKIDMDKMIELSKSEKVKLVLFSNPCNPTGQIVPRAEIIKLIESVNAIIVIDEAYMEFAPHNESVMDLCEKYDNLIVLKTLSKAYGSAAIRLGFAVGGDVLIRSLKKIKSPYNVNSVTQAFGRIVLEHDDETERKVETIRENTAYLYKEIKYYETNFGWKIYPTHTNFVLSKVPDETEAKRIFTELKKKGIAIRLMKGGFLRITAGKIDEIDETLEQMKTIAEGV